MIDQSYQAEINKNLDDQQRRPVVDGAPATPLFKNFSAGFGGFVAGPNQGAAAWADILKADSQIMTATSVNGAGGMFSTPNDAEQKQIDAARDKLTREGADFNSQTGRELRATAKDFLPDPQSTGKAGQILGSLSTFASQAIPEAAAGPAGLVTLGVTRGMQKADELREQGVDEATRTAAGVVSGTLDAATMLLPMTGSSRLMAATKGAAGGAGASIVQTEAEKLILQQGGYDRLASTYDPFDPVSIALSAIVPAGFGALHAPGARPAHAGASPELAAAQAATDAARNDPSRIPTLEAEMAKPETTANSRAALSAEIDRIRSMPAEPARLDPDVEAAARVTQASEGLDRARLTPDDDMAGHDAHIQSVERASDQIARGVPVEVSDIASHAGETEPISAQAVQTIRARDGVIDVAATEAALPPVADGQLRLYRAESPTQGFADVFDASGLAAHDTPEVPGLHFTESLKEADYYRHAYDANRDAQIHYIDVPKELAERGRVGDDVVKVDVAAENAARARAARVGDLVRAAEEYRAAQAPEAAPMKPNHAAFHEARAEAETAAKGSASEKGPRETSAPPAQKPGPVPDDAAAHPGPETTHLDAATAEILRTNPDLMVQMDGMEAPVRAEDFLNAVRESAAEERRDASLLEVAAQCAISL